MIEDHDPFVASAIHGVELSKFASSYGLDFSKICLALQIDPGVFQSVTGKLSNYRFALLLETLTKQSGDTAFAFKYAEQLDMTLLWPISVAVKRAPTLRKALDFLVQSQKLGFSYSKFQVIDEGEIAKIAWEHSPYTFAMDAYWDFNYVLGYKLFCGFGNVEEHIVGLTMTSCKPKHIEEYDRLFLGKVKFASGETSVKFERFVLDRPNPDADFAVYTLLRAQVQAFLKFNQFQTPFDQKVRQKILMSFEEGEPSLSSIAKMVGLTDRSFQRKLLQHGFTFRDILDETRKNLSTRLLTVQRLSIEEISFRVGYKSTSAYSRAAVEWYGKSASQLRSQL